MLRVAEHSERTDTGRQRRVNEDSYHARSPLFAVADGMGGAQAGEVASGTAIEVVAQGLPDAPGSVEERLAGLVAEANVRVHELSVSTRELSGMGTTVTAAYVGETEVALAHVGDSRAYLLRDGGLQRLTHDHSLVEEFVRQGKLTPEEADDHPQRSIITRALGPEAEVEVDRLSVRGRDGDVFLICSDGLNSMVPEAQIARVLREAGDLERAGRALVEAANAAGGRDNITVVLFRVEDVGADAAGVTSSHPAVAAEPAPPPPPPAAAAPAPPAGPRRPEAAPAAPRGRGGRRRRWMAPLAVALILLVPLAGGGYLASQAVFFLGVNDDGAVAVFRGVPYQLPLGIDLYRTEYVTGLTPDQLPPARRSALLDHRLRSHDDAVDLARQLELGQLNAR